MFLQMRTERLVGPVIIVGFTRDHDPFQVELDGVARLELFHPNRRYQQQVHVARAVVMVDREREGRLFHDRAAKRRAVAADHESAGTGAPGAAIVDIRPGIGHPPRAGAGQRDRRTEFIDAFQVVRHVVLGE